MNPDTVETQLRRIRLAAAPAGLRERVLAGSREESPVAPWFFNRRVAIGLAAIWCAILLLRLDTPRPDRDSPVPLALARFWSAQLALVEHFLDTPEVAQSPTTPTPPAQ